jgi:hypothetical protein
MSMGARGAAGEGWRLCGSGNGCDRLGHPKKGIGCVIVPP